MAKGTMAGHENVSLVGAERAASVSLPIHRGANEVSAGVHAGCIDVVVLGVFAHGEAGER